MEKSNSQHSVKVAANSEDSPQEKPGSPGCCGKSRFCKWLRSTYALLYISHGLSAWGDRMWQFAVGMFLVEIDPTSLRLTAIYGFASGGAILFLGAVVGDWVDKNERLHVARTSIIINNIFVVISAAAVSVHMWFEDDVLQIWDGWLSIILQIIIIGSAVVADVASIGRTISIERDWIVVICEDTETLTNTSAFLRRIDLLTNLAAPIITGQVMTFGSIIIGAIFIAAWNIISMIVEYCLLRAIYVSLPALAIKNTEEQGEEPGEKTPLLGSTKLSNSYKSEDGTSGLKPGKEEDSTCNQLLTKVFSSFITFYRGWRLYTSQPIMYAGIGLATVYMTVLGFDNITTGYAKEQGLSESVISILLAVSSIFGVLGTVFFPMLRRKVGLVRTGLISNGIQFASLAICVVSIFTPGSPFDPNFLWRSPPPEQCTNTITMASNNAELTGLSLPLSMMSNDYIGFSRYSEIASPHIALQAVNISNETTTNINCPTGEPQSNSIISISLLMLGIVISRTGLWMFDLTVTQLLLERPADSERGIINGVQNSLNKFMDIIKSILVIFLPWPQTFGYLIILSVAFIGGGGISYAIYARKERGHLFHFEDIKEDLDKDRYQHPELRGATMKE